MAAATLMQQARIAIREGRLVDARRLLRQVIHEEPKNHAAWLLLARTTPDKKLANQYIERARHLQPDSPLVQRAQEDLASDKMAATSKFSFSWLLVPILIGTALILGLVGISYSRNSASEQVKLMPYESVARAAAAPVDSTQEEKTKVSETDPEEFSVPERISPQIIPTAVSPAQIDSTAPGDTDGAIFEPVVISGPEQALPAAILLGIDREASSSMPVAIPDEQLASVNSPAENVTEEEPSVEASQEAETINANDVTDDAAADDAVTDDAVAGFNEKIQDLEELKSERIMADDEASNDPAQAAADERWIDVNLTTQTLTAYEGDTPVLSSLISSGMWQFPTVTGQFRTWIKYDSQDMTGYHLGYNYSLDDVPHVMYFFKDYAIHGAYWHNNFGTPMSHGCVNVNLTDAEWLYNWAPLGTLVNVHY